MAHECNFAGMDWRQSTRQVRSAILLSAISLALVSCGGGGDEPASNTAVLEWDAVVDPNLAGYRIYYGTAPGTYQQPIGKGIEVGMNATTYTVTGLTKGTWYFAATTLDRSGGESPYSNEVSKSF
jgi:hypothetical protein